MKETQKRAFSAFCAWVWVLLVALFNVDWGRAEQTQNRELPAREASRGETPEKSLKGAALKWKDEKQKISCETKAREIREHFLRAREFSIQGDSCSSEQEARRFGEKLEELKKSCPTGFPEQAGFTPKVVKNIRTLQALGKERCSGSHRSGAPQSSP